MQELKEEFAEVLAEVLSDLPRPATNSLQPLFYQIKDGVKTGSGFYVKRNYLRYIAARSGNREIIRWMSALTYRLEKVRSHEGFSWEIVLLQIHSSWFFEEDENGQVDRFFPPSTTVARSA